MLIPAETGKVCMKLKDFRISLAAGLVGVLTSVSAFGGDEKTPVVRQQLTVDASRLSPDLVSLGKLVQSGVGDKVVLTYIQNAPPKRNPTAEELVYLHELGLSSDGMVALLNAVPKVSLTQNEEVSAPARQLIQAQPAQEFAPNAPLTATQVPAQSASVPGNTVISPPPTVVYTQPAPTMVYVERPPVVTYVEPTPRFSFGLNFGHLFGHHHGGHFGSHYYGRHHGGGHYGGHHGGHGGHHGGGHRGGHH